MYYYVPYVLENSLAISTFMFDHAILLSALISYNDEEIRKTYEKEQRIYSQILLNTISYSYNKITEKFIESEILITNYTDLMTSKTCKLYKVNEYLDNYTSIHNFIKNTKSVKDFFTPEEYLEVKKINTNLLNQLNNSLISLKLLHKKINDESITLFFSESFIVHLIEETQIYIYTLDFFDRQMAFTPTYIYKCKYYFNIFLKEHAKYLKNMLFPVDFKYCDEANLYINNFEKIADEFTDEITPQTMRQLNNQTKETTEKFISYNVRLIQNIIHNKYYAAAIPLLNEHILRESNYVTYQLDIFNSLS